MKSNNNQIEIFLYGSTPHSAGYSILGKSSAVEEDLSSKILKICENYDQQLHSAPLFTKSVLLERLDNENLVFMEIFDGWQDHVGRPSRIMASYIINNHCWQQLAANPFLLTKISLPIKRFVPRQRGEIKNIPALVLTSVDWEKLWQQETNFFLSSIKKISPKDRYLIEQICHNQCIEIPVDEDYFGICRLAVYSLPKERRKDIVFRSFSLNEKSVAGICFRYYPYSKEKRGEEKQKTFTLSKKLEIISQSVPEDFNFAIISKTIHGHFMRSNLCWQILFIVICVLILIKTANVYLWAIGGFILGCWLSYKLGKM